MCPIPKSWICSSIPNYRPVSILCTSKMVLERTVLNTFTIISKTLIHLFIHIQSGFIPGDTTVNQLSYLYKSCSQVLDFGKGVMVVFCDISKAFDRVEHKELLKCLKLQV